MITTKIDIPAEDTKLIDALGGLACAAKVESCVAITVQAGPILVSQGCGPSEGGFLEMSEGDCLKLPKDLANLWLAGPGCIVVHDCDLKPEPTGGTTIDGGELTVNVEFPDEPLIVEPQSKFTLTKSVQYQDADGNIGCGTVLLAFSCNDEGQFNEIARTILDSRCNVVSDASIVEVGIVPIYEVSSKVVDFETDICGDDIEVLTNESLFDYVSQFYTDLQDGDVLHCFSASLAHCDKEKGDLGESTLSTTSDSVLEMPVDSGNFLNIDSGGSTRTYKNCPGESIKSFVLKIAQGSIVRVCGSFSRTAEAVLC